MIKGCGEMNIKQESYLTIVKMIKILDHHPLSPPEEGEELSIKKLGGELYFYVIHIQNYRDEDKCDSDQNHIVPPPNPLLRRGKN